MSTTWWTSVKEICDILISAEVCLNSYHLCSAQTHYSQGFIHLCLTSHIRVSDLRCRLHSVFSWILEKREEKSNMRLNCFEMQAFFFHASLITVNYWWSQHPNSFKMLIRKIGASCHLEVSKVWSNLESNIQLHKYAFFCMWVRIALKTQKPKMFNNSLGYDDQDAYLHQVLHETTCSPFESQMFYTVAFHIKILRLWLKTRCS